MCKLQWNTFAENYVLQESDACLNANIIHRALVRDGYTNLQLVTVEKFLQANGRPAYPQNRSRRNQQDQQVQPASLHNAQNGLASAYCHSNVEASSYAALSRRKKRSRRRRDFKAPTTPVSYVYASAHPSLLTGISDYQNSCGASTNQISQQAQRVNPHNSKQAQSANSYHNSGAAPSGMGSNSQTARFAMNAHRNAPSTAPLGPVTAYSSPNANASAYQNCCNASGNQISQQAERVNSSSFQAQGPNSYRSSGVAFPGMGSNSQTARFAMIAHCNTPSTTPVCPVTAYSNPYANASAYSSPFTGIPICQNFCDASGNQISQQAQSINPSHLQAQGANSYRSSGVTSNDMELNSQMARLDITAHRNAPPTIQVGPVPAYSDPYTNVTPYPSALDDIPNYSNSCYASDNSISHQEGINIPNSQARIANSYRSRGVLLPGMRWDSQADIFAIRAYCADQSVWETWNQLTRNGYSVTIAEVMASLAAQGVSGFEGG